MTKRIVVLILSFTFLVSSSFILEQTHLPVGNLNQLNQWSNYTSIQPNLQGNRVLIYTIRSCKPCLKLAEKLRKQYQSDSTKLSSIIYLNPSVMDSSFLAKSILNSAYSSSPYFGVNYELNLDGVHSFPFIAFHDSNGMLQDTLIGYSRMNLNKTVKHLNGY
jgi:thioredoxin-related protein